MGYGPLGLAFENLVFGKQSRLILDLPSFYRKFFNGCVKSDSLYISFDLKLNLKEIILTTYENRSNYCVYM